MISNRAHGDATDLEGGKRHARDNARAADVDRRGSSARGHAAASHACGADLGEAAGVGADSLRGASVGERGVSVGERGWGV